MGGATRTRKTLAVGVDVGGTSMRASLLGPDGKILAESEAKTDVGSGPAGIRAQVVGLVTQALESAGVTESALRGVGVGVPGAVDPGTGEVHHAPNLGWTRVALAAELGRELGVPVWIENDVNAAVLGEARQGAARGASSVLGVWVGTGIGGGLMVGGELYRGARGAAAEIGHQILLPDGPLCGCGNRGCVEALASRTAIEREIRRRIERGEPSEVTGLLAKRGKDRMTSGILRDAYRKGDEVVKGAIEGAIRYLGMAVGSWISVLDPELVVLGGGVVEKLGKPYVAAVRSEALRYAVRAAGPQPRIVASELGDRAGTLGAASLVG